MVAGYIWLCNIMHVTCYILCISKLGVSYMHEPRARAILHIHTHAHIQTHMHVCIYTHAHTHRDRESKTWCASLIQICVCQMFVLKFDTLHMCYFH